eukprot:scaffold59386_cov70-Phaeocystis_antarctica.AAC.1
MATIAKLTWASALQPTLRLLRLIQLSSMDARLQAALLSVSCDIPNAIRYASAASPALRPCSYQRPTLYLAAAAIRFRPSGPVACTALQSTNISTASAIEVGQP